MAGQNARKSLLPLLVGALMCSAAVPAIGAKPGVNLLEAMRDGYVTDFGSLKGAKVDVVDEYGASALSWAVVRNAPAALNELLAAGADPNVVDVNGVGPLLLAIQDNQAAMVAGLLAKGANPNAPIKPHDETPLMAAVKIGSSDIVQMLLDKGAEPNARDAMYGQTALMRAAGNPKIVKLLLAKGADFRVTGKSWDVTSVLYTPPITTLGSTGIPWTNAGEFTVKQGGETALILAVRAGDVESTKMLVDAGADVNQAAADGTTPLMASLYNWKLAPGAIQRAPGRTVETNAKGDLVQVGERGKEAEAARVKAQAVATAAKPAPDATAGAEAAAAKNDAATKANPDARSARIASGALVPTYAPSLELANYLLDRGAKANVADGNGFTPLHGAVLAAQDGGRGGGGGGGRSGFGAQVPKAPAREASVLPVIRRLLEAGADPNHATIYPTPGPVGVVRISPASPGSTTMHVAAQINSPAIADLLGQFKGDPNKLRKDGHSPLSVAAKADDIAVMKVMAKYGANFAMTYDPTDEISDHVVVKTQQRQKQTLLHIAGAAGAAEAVPYLVSVGVPLNAKNAQGEIPLDLAEKQEVFRYKARYEGGVGIVDATVVRETRTTDALKASAGIKPTRSSSTGAAGTQRGG